MSRVRDGRYLLLVAIVAEILAIWFVHWIDPRGYIDPHLRSANLWLIAAR